MGIGSKVGLCGEGKKGLKSGRRNKSGRWFLGWRWKGKKGRNGRISEGMTEEVGLRGDSGKGV